MSSALFDRSKTRAQAPAGSSGTTSTSAQRALPYVPQVTATHQSRDSKQTRLEVFISTNRQNRETVSHVWTDSRVQLADGHDSEGGNKKRKGKKNPTDEEEVPVKDSKLVVALARLALQHESERRVHSRDDNAVFSMPSSGELAKEL